METSLDARKEPNVEGCPRFARPPAPPALAPLGEGGEAGTNRGSGHAPFMGRKRCCHFYARGGGLCITLAGAVRAAWWHSPGETVCSRCHEHGLWTQISWTQIPRVALTSCT